jgi:hypothetical protein
MLDALRRSDDPGLAPRLLAASNAIDLPTHPGVRLADALALLLLCAVIVGLLVATP